MSPSTVASSARCAAGQPASSALQWRSDEHLRRGPGTGQGRRSRAPPREVTRPGQAPGSRARRAARGSGVAGGGRPARELGGGRSRRRRRDHRPRHRRGPARGADGERPDGQGRLVGPQDRREDHPRSGAGALAARPDGLPRGLGGRPHHRAGADVPRPARRRAHLPHRGEALGRGAAGVRPVRPERGRRRLHPRLLRRRDHARRQRLDVPRLAADGRDGDRRERDARGDGRRAHAHGRVGLRPLPRQVGRGGHRAGPALSVLLPAPLAGGPAAGAPGRARGGAARHPRGREQALRHAGPDRRARGRGLLPRGAQALGQGADRGLRPDRRARDRDRREPAAPEGGRAVRGLLRQGRALHLDLQRVQRAAALPRRRARLHDRHPGRAPGHHPRGREDDLRRLRGDRARRSR